jgi:hypothetical protein
MIEKQINTFEIVFFYRVANSTPMVLLLSKLNSFRVNRDNRLLFPTPESPISTTRYKQNSFSLFIQQQISPLNR